MIDAKNPQILLCFQKSFSLEPNISLGHSRSLIFLAHVSANWVGCELMMIIFLESLLKRISCFILTSAWNSALGCLTECRHHYSLHLMFIFGYELLYRETLFEKDWLCCLTNLNEIVFNFKFRP